MEHLKQILYDYLDKHPIFHLFLLIIKTWVRGVFIVFFVYLGWMLILFLFIFYGGMLGVLSSFATGGASGPTPVRRKGITRTGYEYYYTTLE